MATSITLKNIPDEIYTSLKKVAKAHHRSLNNEIIACLESMLLPKKVVSNSQIQRIRTLRKSFNTKEFNADEINQAIKEGRE